MSIRENLEELSDKIAEVYDLELAEELTVIFEDLTENINDYSKQYWSLVKKLAACEKERDEERSAREQAERLVNDCEEMVERVTNILRETEEE